MHVLNFLLFQVNVVTPSTVEQDKETATTARLTLDRYIKQENNLGLEKTAYELEKKIKEYFGNYRCLIKEEINSRPSRNNNRNQNNDNNRSYNPIDNGNRGTQTDLIFDGPASRSSQNNNGVTQTHSYYTTPVPPAYYEYRRLI